MLLDWQSRAICVLVPWSLLDFCPSQPIVPLKSATYQTEHQREVQAAVNRRATHLAEADCFIGQAHRLVKVQGLIPQRFHTEHCCSVHYSIQMYEQHPELQVRNLVSQFEEFRCLVEAIVWCCAELTLQECIQHTSRIRYLCESDGQHRPKRRGLSDGPRISIISSWGRSNSATMVANKLSIVIIISSKSTNNTDAIDDIARLSLTVNFCDRQFWVVDLWTSSNVVLTVMTFQKKFHPPVNPSDKSRQPGTHRATYLQPHPHSKSRFKTT